MASGAAPGGTAGVGPGRGRPRGRCAGEAVPWAAQLRPYRQLHALHLTTRLLCRTLSFCGRCEECALRLEPPPSRPLVSAALQHRRRPALPFALQVSPLPHFASAALVLPCLACREPAWVPLVVAGGSEAVWPRGLFCGVVVFCSCRARSSCLLAFFLSFGAVLVFPVTPHPPPDFFASFVGAV